MAIDAKETMECIRGALIHSIKISYRFARDHPSVPAILLFTLTLYTSFPSLFSLLLSSSPVILCTTLLLGLLLSYGEPNLPETAREINDPPQVSSLKAESPIDDLVVENDETIGVQAHVEVEEEEEEDGIHSEEEVTKERETRDKGIVEEREFSKEKQDEGSPEVGVSTRDPKEFMGLKVETGKAASENRFDSSLGSPWHPVDIHDTALDSESDGAESSSTDASMADIIPMLDELHPLLDSETRQPALNSMGAAASRGSSLGHKEDGEAQEEKDDGNEEAVKWTADDQRNLMDLGTSEIERNRRLENLIAKRRARKNQRLETEKNLIDLDSTMEDLYHFRVQIPPISATRRNPFDLPFSSEENMGLLPIPASAPSVLQPGRNPFDLLSDRTESLSLQDNFSVQERDIFFPRHESFSSGASFSAEIKHDKHDSSSKPDFQAEREEEISFVTLQRELSEENDSKVSAFPEPEIASSVIDQEQHKELLAEEVHQETHLLSPSNHDAEPVEQESRSSMEVVSSDVDREESEIDVGDDHAIELNTLMVTEEAHQAADSFRAVEEEILDASKLEVTEDTYDESSSFPSPEVNVKESDKPSTHEKSVDLEPTRGDSSEVSGDSMQSIPADTNLPSRAGDRVDGTQVAAPVYDSSPSPSAIGDTLSNASTLDEASISEGMGDLNSTISLASVVQADISDPSPRPLEMNISSGGYLSSTDENESKSREIREHDVVQTGLSGVHEDLVDPTALAMPRSVDGLIMHPSSPSSVEPHSGEDSLVDADGKIQSEGDEMIDAATSYSDHVTSSASEEQHSSTDEPAILLSYEGGVEKSQISILNLPPIPEENLEDSKLEEEHESMVHPAGIFGSIGVQMTEEPDVGLCDIEQESSLLQTTITGETESIDSTNMLVHELGNDDSAISPIISNRDCAVTEERLSEPSESIEIPSMLDTKGDLEVESDNVSDSGGEIINEVQSELEGGSSKMLNDPVEEPNELHADDEAREEIDEGLLAELDVVGDFRAEELRSDEVDPEMELQSDGQFVDIDADPMIQDSLDQLQVSEARSVEDTMLPSAACLNDFDELHPVVNQPIEMESSVDSEMTVHNPKLHVLEACSFEELESAFKQLHEGSVVLSDPEPITEESVAAKTEVGSSGYDIADRDPKLAETDSELQVLEAESIEDINNAFKQFHEVGLDKSVFTEVEQSENSAGNLEHMEDHSDLQIVEAKSIEDIDSAFKQLSKVDVDKSEFSEVERSETLEGKRNLDATGSHSDLQTIEAKSLEDLQLALKLISDGTAENRPKPSEPRDDPAVVEASEKHLEPEVLEVQSAEGIRLASDAAAATESGSSYRQSDEESHGLETTTDVTSSGASTSS